MSGIEVKKPIRFFFFFGLFLAFVLLGVRACNERRTMEEVAEVEKILNENKRELIPSKEGDTFVDSEKDLNSSNASELDIFESSGKTQKSTSNTKKKTKEKPKKSEVRVKKNTAQAVINVRPKKEEKSKKPVVVAEKTEPVKETRAPKPSIIQDAVDEVINDKETPKMSIVVSGQGYALDGISQAKLKGAIKLNSSPSKVKILVYSKDSQGRSPVVKRAELKSALIRAGLSTSVLIDFESVDRTGYAEVLFY